MHEYKEIEEEPQGRYVDERWPLLHRPDQPKPNVVLAGFRIVLLITLFLLAYNLPYYLEYHEPQYAFETVPGFFAQSLLSTNASSFDFIKSNFGLLNDNGNIDYSPERWERFKTKIDNLAATAKKKDSYKVLFLARHGEGWHNVAEAYYGTPMWDCYWAEENGNGTITWGPDAKLTPKGIEQALEVNRAWKTQLNASAPLPQTFYSSPLSRAASTLNLTWSDIAIITSPHVHPIFVEGLRESIGLHTCDKRKTKEYLEQTYPDFQFEPEFKCCDELWTPDYQETPEQQKLRLRKTLNRIWSRTNSTYISITAHSGTITAILKNIGHRGFKVQTGGMIPVLVKAVEETSTPADPWPPLPSATKPPCTETPTIMPTAPGMVFKIP